MTASIFSFLDPESLRAFGPFAIVVVCAVIFAETGLLVGFVFPGDTLLLITGISAERGLGVSIWIAAPAIAFAAYLGGELGYLIGSRAGPRIFERRDSGLFSRAQVKRTNAFFDRYGARAVILARFVPVVRTIAPVAAGVGSMSAKRYRLYNAIGATGWGFGITFLGYLIGRNKAVSTFVTEHIDLILLAAVVVTVVPTLGHVLPNPPRPKRTNAGMHRPAPSGD